MKTSNAFTFVDPSLVGEGGSTPTAVVRMAGSVLQPESVLDGVRSAAASSDVPVTMTEAFNRRADTVAMVDRLLSITRLMSLVALVIAAAGIANTVFLSWRERRPDRSLLNTLGLTPMGSAGVMVMELVLLSVPAGLLGWVFGAWAGECIAAVAVG